MDLPERQSIVSSSVEQSGSLTTSISVPAAVSFEQSKVRWSSVWIALRPQHWVKNLLVFVPIVMAHKFTDLHRLGDAMLAFASFSVAASGVYVLNDLCDLEADRLHPIKKLRPFASKELSRWVGFSLVPALLLAGLVISAQVPSRLLLADVLLYAAATTVYSTYVKQIPVLDVLLLTGLYLVRILGGGVASSVPVSPWLLAFSMFLLLSLAFTKRHAELIREAADDETRTGPSKRNYLAQDADLVRQFGVASGYISVLVLALYVNGPEVTTLYRHPQLIWLVCPVLLYWISRVWFIANRERLNEDPVLFAVCDPLSYVLGCLILLILFLAS